MTLKEKMQKKKNETKITEEDYKEIVNKVCKYFIERQEDRPKSDSFYAQIRLGMNTICLEGNGKSIDLIKKEFKYENLKNLKEKLMEEGITVKDKGEGKLYLSIELS